MYEFKFIKAKSINEAINTLQNEENSKIIAGGMTLLPTMKQRLTAPNILIDLSAIESLKRITITNDEIEIGALCSHYEVSTSEKIQKYLPTLSKLAGLIADPQVRFKGTIGGSIANNDPSADYPAALVGLGGIVVTNRREIKAQDFIVGMFTTSLEGNEIIQSIRFPINFKSSYQKFKHPASGYALCGVWMAQNEIERKIAVTGVFSYARRWIEGEEAIKKHNDTKLLENAVIDLDDIFMTHDTTPSYKAQLLRVLTIKALREINND